MTDPVVRRFHRAQRRRQLEILAGLRRVDDALMLFTLERTLDAVAQGETDDLGLDEATLIARLRDVVRAALAPNLR